MRHFNAQLFLFVGFPSSLYTGQLSIADFFNSILARFSISKVICFLLYSTHNPYQLFQVWAYVTPLTFQEVSSSSSANFKIKFAGLGNHGDGYPFTVNDNVLAHAFMPQDGKVHFNDAKNWTVIQLIQDKGT